MKKLLLMLCFTLLSFWGYTQFFYTVEQFKKIFGCDPNETVSECKTRLRNAKLSLRDSLKREEEWRKYEEARYKREQWEIERSRRDKLTPEERAKEDEKRAMQSYNEKKKIEDVIDLSIAINNADKSGSDPSYNPLIGILLGVHVRIMNISDEISLGGGAAYSMQGGKYESSDYTPGGNYGSSTSTSRLNYLNFPLLVRYQKNRAGFFAEAGLQPGLLLSAKNKGTATTDIKDEIKGFDVGIPVGVGYKFKNKFSAGLRLTPGLINVNKDEQYKNRNIVASLRASYSL